MPEALFFQNQKLGDEYVSALEAAQSVGITAIASGSLLQGQVARGLPEAIRDPLGSLATDAQTGIQFVRSAPGITTALVGMSQRAHVEENLQLVALPRRNRTIWLACSIRSESCAAVVCKLGGTSLAQLMSAAPEGELQTRRRASCRRTPN